MRAMSSSKRESFLFGRSEDQNNNNSKNSRLESNEMSTDVEAGRSLNQLDSSSCAPLLKQQRYLQTFPLLQSNNSTEQMVNSSESDSLIGNSENNRAKIVRQSNILPDKSTLQRSTPSQSSNKTNNGSTFGNIFPIRKWNGSEGQTAIDFDSDKTAANFNNNNNTVNRNGINNNSNNNNNNNSNNNNNNNNNQMELIWRNLCYDVTRFKWQTFIKEKGHGYTRQRLLNSISGSIRAGELMAIMGPSGAGKTTLIECISGRRRIGVSGDIMVTNCTKRTKLAYMAQSDSFMPCLTIFETLLFASKLRNYQRNNRCKVKLIDDNENVYNATTFPDSDLVISLPDETYHKNLVNQIIHKLGLDPCRNVKAENCSGGQQKRLCIALELIHSPSILILDEPTSGLDSVSCLQCVKLLRDLAHNPEQPMAIAASIHQPTARILQNFDRLYVLASNGKCMYDGPTAQLVPHLAKYNLACQTYHNPADFVLEVASGDYGLEAVNQLVAAQCTQHETGCLVKCPTTMSNDIKKEEEDEDEDEYAGAEELRLWPESHTDTITIRKICQRSRKQIKRREFYKTMILWLRCMLLAIRDSTEYLLRIFSCVSIILLNIVLYKDSDIGHADGCSQDSLMHLIDTIRSDYDGNQTFSLTNSLLEGPGALAILNFGFIFFAMVFVAFLSLMPVILTFPLEVAVFYKEYFNGWYSFSSYFFAKNLTNLIPTIILPIIFAASTYLITRQLWEPWRFFYFILILVLVSLVADGVGIIISAVFVHNVNAASIFAATTQIPLLLFTGLLVQIDSLPIFIRPLTYLSYYRLCFEACVIVFYGYGRCPKPEPFDLKKVRQIIGDDVEEVMDCVWQNTNFLDNKSNEPSLLDRFERIMQITENQNPSLIMQNFKLKDEDLHFLIILLAVYALISRIIAYFVLYRKANSRR